MLLKTKMRTEDLQPKKSSRISIFNGIQTKLEAQFKVLLCQWCISIRNIHRKERLLNSKKKKRKSQMSEKVSAYSETKNKSSLNRLKFDLL
ncbi:hypothetical protein BpHYR1_014103 [Brachionus plicatilis]|uniref:Uncharacterized protein n=1 Tax=Brachionus plicatilis TaxID=10195 RepID=A0A3M7P971_BRAPC|nr:hypothetical protein BpHYR1_014103 [Brachionus plicatilis]